MGGSRTCRLRGCVGRWPGARDRRRVGKSMQGGDMGVSRAIGVFSKKLLRRRGVCFWGISGCVGGAVDARSRGSVGWCRGADLGRDRRGWAGRAAMQLEAGLAQAVGSDRRGLQRATPGTAVTDAIGRSSGGTRPSTAARRRARIRSGFSMCGRWGGGVGTSGSGVVETLRVLYTVGIRRARGEGLAVGGQRPTARGHDAMGGDPGWAVGPGGGGEGARWLGTVGRLHVYCEDRCRGFFHSNQGRHSRYLWKYHPDREIQYPDAQRCR